MKPNYYAIIPATVRYSKLKPNAKLLYGEITALASKEGYCFASNRYFANLYEVTKNTISSWISDLNKEGFITVQIIKEGNQVVQRRIGITQKEDTPTHKKEEYNNTSIPAPITPFINQGGDGGDGGITTINNSNKERHTWIEFKKVKFGQEINDESQGILTVEQANEFLSYWSEANKSKTKMRWELERTWDLRSRMQRWNNNTKKWDKPGKKQNTLKNKLATFSKAKQMMNQINEQ